MGKHRRASESFVDDDEIDHDTFFWRAHTVSVLVIVISTICYVVFIEDPVDDWRYNTKRGILAGMFMFLAFGITQARNGPFIRPHPIIWRTFLCISVIYELSLVFLLFQTIEDARSVLTLIDPALNKPLDFRAYGGSCTLYDPDVPENPFHNLLDKMDGFVIAHAIGWFLKALVIRDFWLATIISFTFELLEYTFEHQLPNFSECWWDHWILDFLLCNGLGIYFGLKLMDHFSIKEYKWRSLYRIRSYRGKMRRAFQQFSPYSWVQFRWEPTENLYRWFLVSSIVVMFLIAEVNTFYLKFVLWVNPEHPLVLGRLVLLIMWAAVAIREVYDFGGGATSTFGQQAWICCAIIMTELMIIFKFGGDVLSKPFPEHIKWLWSIIFSFYVIYSIWKFQMKFPRIKAMFRQFFPKKKTNNNVEKVSEVVSGTEQDIEDNAEMDAWDSTSSVSDYENTTLLRHRTSLNSAKIPHQ